MPRSPCRARSWRSTLRRAEAARAAAVASARGGAWAAPPVPTAPRPGPGTLPSAPPLALGSGEATLDGPTAGYATFAGRGVYHTPILIRRVEDTDGTVLFHADTTGARVVSEDTAFLLTSM